LRCEFPRRPWRAGGFQTPCVLVLVGVCAALGRALETYIGGLMKSARLASSSRQVSVRWSPTPLEQVWPGIVKRRASASSHPVRMPTDPRLIVLSDTTHPVQKAAKPLRVPKAKYTVGTAPIQRDDCDEASGESDDAPEPPPRQPPPPVAPPPPPPAAPPAAPPLVPPPPEPFRGPLPLRRRGRAGNAAAKTAPRDRAEGGRFTRHS
jgi:hypothetical protein